jgi:hypothetical protein
MCSPRCRWAARIRPGATRFASTAPTRTGGRRYELLALPGGCAVDLLEMDR